MGIDDYTLSGGVDSRAEEILSTGINATPESIQGRIAELKNRDYKSDLEYLLGWQGIEFLEQRLNVQRTSEVIMGYQEDLRNAISALQSRLESTMPTKANQTDVDAALNAKANTSDIEDLDLTINNLNTVIEGLRSAINALSTTVEGKANSSDLQALNESLTNLSEQLSALSSTVAGKADASDIVAPSWGNITGTLSSQTDLKDALDGKADAEDLQALNIAVDNKASTSDLQALSSVLVSIIDEKADKIALDAVNTTVEGKADAPKTFTATLSASSWGTTKPFYQSVTVSGILSTDEPFTDIKLTDNATTATQELQSWGCVSDIRTSDNLISALCLEKKPTVNMTIRMKVIR